MSFGWFLLPEPAKYAARQKCVNHTVDEIRQEFARSIPDEHAHPTESMGCKRDSSAKAKLVHVGRSLRQRVSTDISHKDSHEDIEREGQTEVPPHIDFTGKNGYCANRSFRHFRLELRRVKELVILTEREHVEPGRH